MAAENKYLYGPVPSRRLGLSLGIDIVPFKVCTLDCIYCQLGRTIEKTVERKHYIPIEDTLSELKEELAKGIKADFITISGSGEPTLNSQLGQLIDGIKKITNIPVAILTNGTLLYRKDVRNDCAKADVVIPSLDAGDEQTFQRINRPHKDISIKKLISGLQTFRNEFTGKIWLEVFLIEGVNTDSEQIAKIDRLIKRIHPHKIQLNTAIRPTADADIKKPQPQKVLSIAKYLGPKCEVIADFSRHRRNNHIETQAQQVLSMLKRRPCSLNDICSGLGIAPNEALKFIDYLQNHRSIKSEQRNGTIFYKAVSEVKRKNHSTKEHTTFSA